MKCPKCGSKRVAPILYGMPAYDEELERKINSEEVYLGGCIISGSDPQYHCFGCGAGGSVIQFVEAAMNLILWTP